MKVNIVKDVLVDSLDNMGKVLPSKPVITSLGGIRMKSVDGGVSLSATNLELTMNTFVPCDVENEGDILFPGKGFVSIVRVIPDKTVRFITKDNSLFIYGEKFKYKFLLMNVEEHPEISLETHNNKFSISPSYLLDMVNKTRYCINRNEPRPQFRGALLEGDNQTLSMVATDTRRLAFVNKTVNGCGEMGVILPTSLLDILPSIIKDKEVDVSYNDNQISFKSVDTVLTSQLLDGEFPDYKKIVPTVDSLNKVVIERKSFYESISRISLLLSDKVNFIKMSIRNNNMCLSFENSEVGTGEENVVVEYVGPDIDILFNAGYIIDFLKTTNKEKLGFYFVNAQSPALFKSIGEEEYQYVVMPIKPYG